MKLDKLAGIKAVVAAAEAQLIRLAFTVLVLCCSLTAPLSVISAGGQNPKHTRAPGVRTHGQGQSYRPFHVRATPLALNWAEAQLPHMSLNEKIGQLIAIGVNGKFLNQYSDGYRFLRRQVESNHIGGIVLYQGSVYEAVHLTNLMQGLSRYPLLVSADMEYGAAMRFDDTVNLPTNMAIAATGDQNYARRQGEIIAQEARALGVRQIFGPVVDVNNNPLNPIINVRAYSENAQEVASLSAAFIRGAQVNGVIATAKHFPGHGNTVVDSHRGLPVLGLDRAQLNSVELVPYREAIATGVGSVMASFISIPKLDSTPIKALLSDRRTGPSEVVQGGEVATQNATLPAALSPVVIRELLRSELHFNGLIVTDALDMSGLTIYFNQDEAAVRAIEAGGDMLIKPSDPDSAVRGLRQAVKTGRVSESRIDESVRRILAAKYDLGLIRNRITPLTQISRLLSNPRVVAFVKEVAEHAITLVRNDANQVPLKIRTNVKIFNFVVTNGDDRMSIAIPFSGEMARQGISMETAVLDGRSSAQEIDQAIERARKSDLIIASLYSRVRAGESASVALPASSTKALVELSKGHIPVVGISFGNPYILQAFPELRTYIVAYGDMPSLQEAAARALLGKAGIRGRLPITLHTEDANRKTVTYLRGTGIQISQN